VNWFDLVVLAILQGLTEFLPVSSSGHLVIAMAVLEKAGHQILAPISVNIALHIGTLAATVAYFRRQLWDLLWKDRRTLSLVILATIPAVVIGVPVRKLAPSILESPWIAAFGLLGTGVLLLAAQRRATGQRQFVGLRWTEALVIGCFQALALLPGISRSGSSIAGGIFCGLAPGEAAVFAFLLAVPVMVGAGLLEAVELLSVQEVSPPWLQLLWAAALAGLVGWWAIAWLLHWVRTGRLGLFAVWVLVLGSATLFWLTLVALGYLG
jgi:undecaprenyl-diphosphatase